MTQEEDLVLARPWVFLDRKLCAVMSEVVRDLSGVLTGQRIRSPEPECS